MKKSIYIIAVFSLLFMACKETKTVLLKSTLIACNDGGAKKCIQYKEKGDHQWKLFSEEIEGFTYEEGYTYELEVDIEKKSDKSPLKYTLKKVIKKERDLAMNIAITDKKELAKLGQEDMIVKYGASTRGYFFEMVIYKNHMTILKVREGKSPRVYKVLSSDVAALREIISTIDLPGMAKLVAPTNKRRYDGALFTSIIVNKKGVEYRSVTFDGGFPPKEIKPLVDKILSLVPKGPKKK